MANGDCEYKIKSRSAATGKRLTAINEIFDCAQTIFSAIYYSRNQAVRNDKDHPTFVERSAFQSVSDNNFGKYKTIIMRKILIAFDGTQYSESPLQFVAALNGKEPVTVVGVFLPLTNIISLWSYADINEPEGGTVPLVENNVGTEIRNNIKRFQQYCIDHGIDHRVHTDYFDFAIPELKKESRFADLLIIDSESFYADTLKLAGKYLEECLRIMECPVVLIPGRFEFPSLNILSYDGSESSVYAIKQFAYLFPEFTNNDTTLVHADAHINEPFPDELNVKNLVSRHFPRLRLFKLEADPKKYFGTWLANTGAAVLVSGAFGGSSLHRLFHESFVSDIIKEQKVILFVTHK